MAREFSALGGKVSGYPSYDFVSFIATAPSRHFDLAARLRPRKVSEFKDPKDLRAYLVQTLKDFRHERQIGVITDFACQYAHPKAPPVTPMPRQQASPGSRKGTPSCSASPLRRQAPS